MPTLPIVIEMRSYVGKTVREFKEAVVAELKKIPAAEYKRPIIFRIEGCGRVIPILDNPDEIIPAGEALSIEVNTLIGGGYGVLIFYSYTSLVENYQLNKRMAEWVIR